MLPAGRALTSRPLATSTIARWPAIIPRYRYTRASGTIRKFRGPRTQPGRAQEKWSIPLLDPKNNASATGTKTSNVQSFIPWLSSRLQALEENISDPGYATFARNLRASLANRSIQAALEKRRVRSLTSLVLPPSDHQKSLSLLRSLQEAYRANGPRAADLQLRYAYQGLLTNPRFRGSDLQDQQRLADLRYPVEWYPATRELQRKIIMHVGPTNSGKTYQALKRLEQAKSGIYAGPLRLLAHEVFTRLNTKGRKCDLITGDERSLQDGADMKSCTVEMVPLNADVEVAVIDEIQMIGQRDRGWAWTQALLGLKAKEIHVCGEERSVPLIRELVASMGDKLEINTYKRLSPLEVSTSLNGRIENLRKGDCVVIFSVVEIHAMKKEIEKVTQKRVAIVYGKLPPEIRAQQAKLFNDPDNDYDFLVASDAIGMGLNLAIKRIVFESLVRFNGWFNQLIDTAHLKQIAGRAGRYRTSVQAEGPSGVPNEVATDIKTSAMQSSSPNVGLVTTFERDDLPIVRAAMQEELDPIMSAGVFPPTTVVLRFAAYFPPATDFSYILQRLHKLSLMHPRYHLCDLRDQIAIADIIQPVQNLTIHDRIVFCAAPASVRTPGISPIVVAFARCVGSNTSGALLDIPQLPLYILDEDVQISRNYTARLELLHQSLVLYLWLSYRFAGVFVSQAMAFYVKKLVEERIDKVLAEYSSSRAIRQRMRKMREEALRQISTLNEPVAEPDHSQAQVEVLDPHVFVEKLPAQAPER